MPAIRLPYPDKSLSTLPVEQQIPILTDLLMRYRRELEYLLNGQLDEENGVVAAIITNTLITQSLYAERGYIAELTVDQLDTSTKVQNYLLHDTNHVASVADVNYTKIKGQSIQEITAVAVNHPATAQATDRKGNLLYWDVIAGVVSHMATTLAANAYPVLIWTYTEQVKMEQSFALIDGVYRAQTIYGTGSGNPINLDRMKGFIVKDALGLLFRYVKSDDTEVWFRLGENGAEGSLGKNVEITAIEFNTQGMDVTYADAQAHNWSFVKNVAGRIIRLDNLSTNRHIDISYLGV